MIENILLVIAGFFLLIKGADILVEGSVNIAKKFNISEIIVGLTIVSIGTSLPELMVSLASAISGHSDVAMGNVIGSNLCNLLLIMGLSSIIAPIKFKKETKLIEIPITLVVVFTMFLLGNNGGINKVISRPEGVILIIMFVCFLFYTILMAKYGKNLEGVEEKSKSSEERDIGYLKSWFFIICGIVSLKFGGDFVVKNACEIASNIGISEKIISLTIVALGTSLPELITSLTATRKGDSDIAIGNILGSNIFNFLLIIGVSSIISPVNYSVDYNLDMMILFISSVLLILFPYIGKKNEMSRSNGIIYLLGYIGYMVMLFVK